MKFTINKYELSEILTNLLGAVSNKIAIPALEGILLKTIDNQIEMTAYDLELGMKTLVSANITEQGTIVIPANTLNDIVKKAPANTITITINEKNIANIISGHSSFDIPCISADEYPELPNVTNKDSISVPANMLKSMIKQTIFAVADNDTKPINQGSKFTIENGNLDIVSVDGYRLAIRSEKIKSEFNDHFVVPGKTLSKVLKINSNDEEDIIITPERRHIMLKIGAYTLISSILEGEFIDYKNTIPSQSTTEIKIKTKDFIDGVERVSLVISDRLKSPVRCHFVENEIKLSCTTAKGKAIDDFPCELNGQSIEMGFNNKYLLEALKNCDCDEVLLKITGAINPVVICPPEGDRFKFLVLPLRLRN